jgi:hypothetical protein
MFWVNFYGGEEFAESNCPTTMSQNRICEFFSQENDQLQMIEVVDQ